VDHGVSARRVETPEFDEIGVAPEVTMYVAQLETNRTWRRRTPVRRPSPVRHEVWPR